MAEMGYLMQEFMGRAREAMEGLGDFISFTRMESPAAPPKDPELAEAARKKANVLYVKDKHDSALHYEILQNYNESIARAPIGSEELGMAYGNKSALLRHLRKYRECICEIDKALKLTSTDILKVKLLCRKAECLTALGSSDNRGSLEKARFILNKTDDEDLKSDLSILIETTEKIIDEEQLEVPKKMKENDRGRGQALKTIMEAESLKPSASLKLEDSRSRGYNLVATRNLNVGEIIVAERPYRNLLEDKQSLVHCSHCLFILWTAVPCNTCCWRLYCSEKCRDEAHEEYHDLECPTLPYLRFMMEFHECQEFHLALSVFLKALKQAGGITQLQNQMKIINKATDRGIKLDEKFKTLKHLCKLPLRAAVSDNGITYGIFCVVNTVSVLAKTTSVFGKPYNFRELKNLAKNDSVVFAAALMARFYFSRPSRCGPNGSDVRHKIDDRGKLSIVSSPTPMNYIFGSLAHLAVASCIPNVEVCSTYGNMVVIYPIQPIKKGSIIFKPLSSVYEFTPDTARQTMHKIIFNSSCDCRACKEGWSKKLGNPMKELMISADESAVIQKLVEEIQQVKSSISTRVDLDIKLVSKMKKITEKAWEHCPMPSRVTVEAVRTMVKIFEIFYGIGEVSQGDMPTQCKI